VESPPSRGERAPALSPYISQINILKADISYPYPGSTISRPLGMGFHNLHKTSLVSKRYI
jgi:hypothetical protein